MIEESFARGDSFLHRRDPRGKIVAVCLFAATVALLDSFAALVSALLVAIALLLLARLPLRPVGKRLALVNGLTLFLWLSLPFTYGGELLSVGPLDVSLNGCLLAARISLKSNAIILAIIALLATSTIAELGGAMDRMRLPKKICFLLLYSYRYIFVIHQEYLRLLRAARLRAFTPGTNLHTYRTFAYLFGMTLVKSYNRSERVRQAMLLRGFDGRLVSLHRFRFTRTDGAFVTLVGIAALAMIITNLLR